MAAWGYEFYLRVLKVSLTSERSERVEEILSAREDKIRIPARPCNILYIWASLCQAYNPLPWVKAWENVIVFRQGQQN